MIGVGELRKGVVIELDGTLFTVVEYQHIKVGRGSSPRPAGATDRQGSRGGIGVPIPRREVEPVSERERGPLAVVVDGIGAGEAEVFQPVSDR